MYVVVTQKTCHKHVCAINEDCRDKCMRLQAHQPERSSGCLKIKGKPFNPNSHQVLQISHFDSFFITSSFTMPSNPTQLTRLPASIPKPPLPQSSSHVSCSLQGYQIEKETAIQMFPKVVRLFCSASVIPCLGSQRAFLVASR